MTVNVTTLRTKTLSQCFCKMKRAVTRLWSPQLHLSICTWYSKNVHTSAAYTFIPLE